MVGDTGGDLARGTGLQALGRLITNEQVVLSLEYVEILETGMGMPLKTIRDIRWLFDYLVGAGVHEA